MKNSSSTKEKIMEAATDLFTKKGYKNTSVESIIKEVNVAKGTFYYYFESKEDLLKEVVENILVDIISYAKSLETRTDLSALQKIEYIFSLDSYETKKADAMKESLHQQKNRELHEEINTQLVIKLSPIVANFVRQGVSEGIFNVNSPLETVQFLIVASQFLFDEGLFRWSSKEYKNRRLVMQEVFEKALGAKKGSFEFLVN